MSRPPLAGVRILAVSQFGAGPFGTSDELLRDVLGYGERTIEGLRARGATG